MATIGLGTISGMVSGTLHEKVSIQLSSDNFDSIAGVPLTLQAREHIKVKATISAAFGIFASAAAQAGDGPASVTFSSIGGPSFTIPDAIMTQDSVSFSGDGVAIRNVQWLGSSLVKG